MLYISPHYKRVGGHRVDLNIDKLDRKTPKYL